MRRTRALFLAVATAALMGAAPATPTYIAVEEAIARIRTAWAKPGATPDPNAPGWNALFDAIRRDLAAYSASKTEDDRLRALGHLYQISVALDGIAWQPAVEIRDELRTWLRPRVVLAWAERQLVQSVQTLPATVDANAQGNRQRWVDFVGKDLGAALREYEGASEVRNRVAALRRVYGALNSLQSSNQQAAWGPSVNLQTALNDLYNGPNLQATADANAVSPRLANYVVETGPIVHKGQTSYVTAGPFMGFGLLACDDGIMFYNMQAMSSVTPINGFQQQVASDQKGRRAAKLYQFNATSTDQGVVTIIAVLRPTGLQLYPQASHNVQATVGSLPQAGKGLARGFASLLGLNQYKITQKVWEGAIPKIRAQVPQESAEVAREKADQRQAETNATLHNIFLGPQTAAVKNFEIDGLVLRSRPQFVIVDGRVKWLNATEQTGAEMPKPSKFATVNSGVSADVHLASVMTNLTRGYLQSPDAQNVHNLMIVTRKVPPGANPREGIAVTQNVDFATYLKAATESRTANDPSVQAIRVKRPGHSPEFSVDRNGYLVALVHDFSLEVPAPAAAARGGLGGAPANIYRMEAPNAEVVISVHVEPAQGNVPVKLSGRVEAFDAGPDAKVFAINEDESKAARLNAFTERFVLAAFGARLRGQPIDLPLGNLNLPNLAVSSVSAIDPTGWMRVVLTPVGR